MLKEFLQRESNLNDIHYTMIQVSIPLSSLLQLISRIEHRLGHPFRLLGVAFGTYFHSVLVCVPSMQPLLFGSRAERPSCVPFLRLGWNGSGACVQFWAAVVLLNINCHV